MSILHNNVQRTSNRVFKKFNFELQHSMGNKKIIKRYNFILATIRALKKQSTSVNQHVIPAIPQT